MNNAIKVLERAALQVHKQNMPWSIFWLRVVDQVRQAEPYDRQRYGRLVRHLLHCVVSGDASGEHPADVGTEARCLWEPGGSPPSMGPSGTP